MLSSALVRIWIKYYTNCLMYYLLPTTRNVEKITEFISESIPKFISIIWENIWWIWCLPFMNLYKLDVKNKNTNLYCRFYILFIRNQRKMTKKWLPNKYRFHRFHPYGQAHPLPYSPVAVDDWTSLSSALPLLSLWHMGPTWPIPLLPKFFAFVSWALQPSLEVHPPTVRIHTACSI
jgi:hypothetical protein